MALCVACELVKFQIDDGLGVKIPKRKSLRRKQWAEILEYSEEEFESLPESSQICPSHIEKQFHIRFDGLKIRHVSDRASPKVAPYKAIREMNRENKLVQITDARKLLEVLNPTGNSTITIYSSSTGSNVLPNIIVNWPQTLTGTFVSVPQSEISTFSTLNLPFESKSKQDMSMDEIVDIKPIIPLNITQDLPEKVEKNDSKNEKNVSEPEFLEMASQLFQNIASTSSSLPCLIDNDTNFDLSLQLGEESPKSESTDRVAVARYYTRGGNPLNDTLQHRTLQSICNDATGEAIINELENGVDIDENRPLRIELVRRIGGILMNECNEKNHPTPNEICAFAYHLLGKYTQLDIEAYGGCRRSYINLNIQKRRIKLAKQGLATLRPYKKNNSKEERFELFPKV